MAYLTVKLQHFTRMVTMLAILWPLVWRKKKKASFVESGTCRLPKFRLFLCSDFSTILHTTWDKFYRGCISVTNPSAFRSIWTCMFLPPCLKLDLLQLMQQITVKRRTSFQGRHPLPQKLHIRIHPRPIRHSRRICYEALTYLVKTGSSKQQPLVYVLTTTIITTYGYVRPRRQDVVYQQINGPRVNQWISERITNKQVKGTCPCRWPGNFAHEIFHWCSLSSLQHVPDIPNTFKTSNLQGNL